MRKDFALPALALVGGAAGFAVRLWQRSSALDPATNLFTHGAPATWALLALTAAVAVLALVLCPGGRTFPEGEEDKAFQCPSSGYMTLMVIAAMGFLASAVAGVPQLMEDLRAWQADPSRHLLPAALALSILGCVAGAIGSLVLGKSNYRAVSGEQVRLAATLPAYAALPWLIRLYQVYSSDPVLLNSFVPLLAAVFLLLALHGQAAFFYRRPRCRSFTVFAVMGVYFGLTALADRLSLFDSLLAISFVVCTFGALTALSARRFSPTPLGPRMPQEDVDDGTI